MQSLSPRIAVIGFGMSGVAFTNALRHAELFSADAVKVAPQITVFESMPRVGGKMAPMNLGAQFIDAKHFYPVYGPNGLVERLGLKTYAPRPDYDECDYVSHSGSVLPARRFLECLMILRESARKALQGAPWHELDRRSAIDFISDHLKRGIFSALDAEAMVSRLGFEEGTTDISLLSWAINLAKSDSPMPRFELVGGFHALAEAERGELTAQGHEILTGTAVGRLDVLESGVRVSFKKDGTDRNAVFDHVLLAIAPEHYGRIAVHGAKLPIATVSGLKAAAITKTNVGFAGQSSEIATHRYARWHDVAGETSDETRVNFFHGWEGEPRLSETEVLIQVMGANSARTQAAYRSQTWDGGLVEGTPHAYTTMPRPGQGMALTRLALNLYIEGTHDGERVRLANQALGLGCYTRDSALSGEWAAVSLLRALGLNVNRAHDMDPWRLFTGMDRDTAVARIAASMEHEEKRAS